MFDNWWGLGVLSFKIAFLWDDWSEKLREGEFFSLLIDWSFWVKPIVSFDLLYCRKKVFCKKDYTSYLHHQTMIERSNQFAIGGNSNHSNVGQFCVRLTWLLDIEFGQLSVFNKIEFLPKVCHKIDLDSITAHPKLCTSLYIHPIYTTFTS